MTDICPRSFEQDLLSGYLDRELTQAESQKVRLHLEECSACRELIGDLRRVKEATMSTEFQTPADEQWQEKPHTPASGFFRRVGWLVILIWGLGVGALGIWGLLTSPGDWWEKALVVAVVAGPALLLLSVLLDRLRSLPTDRYRRVEK